VNGAELRRRLGLSQRRLAALLKAGLPCTGRGRGREFDPLAVRAWLTAQGLVESPVPKALPEEILATWREVAARFERAERVIATWAHEGCPKPPVSAREIETWAIAHGKRVGPESQSRDPLSVIRAQLQGRKLAAEVELVEHRAARERARVVPVAEVLATVLPYLAACRNLLEQLPERLLGHVPPESRAGFRAEAEREVENLLLELRDAAAALPGVPKNEPA
jgi:hypothetical protein